ncbi:peptidoglycan recognition family protein [Chryseobacterium gambrini]|uniref:N-acetylmuramoyl-L-alanine amidase n=1 Tax=Chryseobacterium gambrini TaxID=373672 RepID=A0AAJ1VL90_9FLAO|nr:MULTISPECIES: peptidoglycan recognition family protein [Chryseobacterium]MDN4014418.1 peptidoglycan recognition family protein [Chryseobacterium gambrini]MDN4029765.1 peptidoglycan recognition family protein [Chryseobacterium gambrini]QWA37198.1 peptidoglycan recognition protein family protein [Chryseobacterium sp. ZHDP1]
MRNVICLLVFMLMGFVSAQKNELKIINKPINYSEERVRLSLEYLKEHHGLVQKIPTIVPKMIVLHYTAGGNVENNFKYFNKTHLENARNTLKKQSTLNVSSQFIIDRDGTVYQLMEPNQFARHTIGLNYCAIGIENIGSKKEPLTDKQVSANAQLIRYLTQKYKIEYLIGHSEYGIFRNSKLWKESDPNYFTGKEDPGKDFMNKVRLQTADLHLKDKP